jgi:hypothetical protein
MSTSALNRTVDIDGILDRYYYIEITGVMRADLVSGMQQIPGPSMVLLPDPCR